MAKALQVVLPSAALAIKTLDKLEIEIHKATTFEALDRAARTAQGLQVTFKPVKDVADRAGEVWIEAEVKLAEELGKLPKAEGTRGRITGPGRGHKTAVPKENRRLDDTPTRAQLGVSKKRSAIAAKLKAIGKTDRKRIEKNLKDADKPVNPNSVLAEYRKESKEERKQELISAKFSAKGPFDVVVIDPPWEVQKIDRDVRPNQAKFDYKTMSKEEIDKFWRKDMTPRLKKDCHLFMWTTQKYLPTALELATEWGFRYVLLMVWHKAGGFQPIDLPQYNCEFIVYARRGKPMFTDTKNFFCCFEAERRQHSRKPDAFYDTIGRVTAGSRIDVFSREQREGFAQYGNEPKKFERAA